LFVFLYKEERIELMPAAQKQGKQMAAQKQGKQIYPLPYFTYSGEFRRVILWNIILEQCRKFTIVEHK
jgi:hypothetical protein